MFGNFLKDIVNDEIESQRILDKADYIERTMQVSNQLQDNDKSKYGDNSNICIIAASGNYSTLGVVTSCNNEITRILGFSKMDLIGQKVNRLMPKFYSDLHDSFMNKFLETSESKVIG
jgi:hypothetical protein